MTDTRGYAAPNALARALNRVLGAFVSLGIGFRQSYLLEVRGRKTGRVRSLPVNVLDLEGRRYLVAPRGRTEWARNAEVAGEITLKRGGRRETLRVRALHDGEKPLVLKTYLDRFSMAVQRFFPVRAGSAVDAFVAIADRYPVFELIETR